MHLIYLNLNILISFCYFLQRFLMNLVKGKNNSCSNKKTQFWQKRYTTNCLSFDEKKKNTQKTQQQTNMTQSFTLRDQIWQLGIANHLYKIKLKCNEIYNKVGKRTRKTRIMHMIHHNLMMVKVRENKILFFCVLIHTWKGYIWFDFPNQ